MIRSISKFIFEESDKAMQGMQNLRNAVDYSIVTEIINYANGSFKVALITLLNQSLVDGLFDESLYL